MKRFPPVPDYLTFCVWIAIADGDTVTGGTDVCLQFITSMTDLTSDEATSALFDAIILRQPYEDAARALHIELID